MRDSSQPNRPEVRPFPVRSMVAYAALICIAIDAALVMSVAGQLSWIYSAAVAFSAVILAGGMLFTAREILELSQSRHSR